jgi:hypothetical protein
MKVTKWSTHSGDLTVSEHQAEQTPGESSSGSIIGSMAADPVVGGEPAAASATAEPIAASAPEIVVESPAIAPDHEAPVADEAAEVEPIKAKAAKVQAYEEAIGPKLPKGNLLIMSPRERAWQEPAAAPQAASARADRRLSAMAAVAALAIIAGALGGALATTGLMHSADAGAATTPSGNPALEAAVARIDADIVALKAGLEQTSKTGLSQFTKTSDRLERIEKAQAEPAVKLAKLSEAVEKLRTAQQAAPIAAAAAAPKEVTGSVTVPPGAAPLPTPAAPTMAAATPKSEVGKLPTVDGWYLADIGYGGALIQNRRGTYEVYAGDFIPGLGRIDAIRKQDGRWVVVTSKGLIVAR